MKHLILKWLINALALILIAYLVPGITVASFYVALVFALVLGLLNLTVRPLLVLLTLPITLLTLGLFTLVINGFIFWLTARVVSGFEVASFWTAVVGALLFSIIHYLGEKIFIRDTKEE